VTKSERPGVVASVGRQVDAPRRPEPAEGASAAPVPTSKTPSKTNPEGPAPKEAPMSFTPTLSPALTIDPKLFSVGLLFHLTGTLIDEIERQSNWWLEQGAAQANEMVTLAKSLRAQSIGATRTAMKRAEELLGGATP
jgi:hypothetical protein